MAQRAYEATTSADDEPRADDELRAAIEGFARAVVSNRAEWSFANPRPPATYHDSIEKSPPKTTMRDCIIPMNLEELRRRSREQVTSP